MGFNIKYLLGFLKSRISAGNSYVGKIGNDHEELSKKLLEEAFEVAIAKTREEKMYEATDLLFFLLVYLAKEDISFDELVRELERRHKKN